MAEYIEREALIKDIESRRLVFKITVTVEEALVSQGNAIRKAIEEAPAADVVEVKHGEWQEIDNLVIEHGLPTVKGKTWRCSICGEARKNRTAPDMNYCPNCGAKMDLKEGAEE